MFSAWPTMAPPNAYCEPVDIRRGMMDLAPLDTSILHMQPHQSSVQPDITAVLTHLATIQVRSQCADVCRLWGRILCSRDHVNRVPLWLDTSGVISSYAHIPSSCCCPKAKPCCVWASLADVR